MRARWRLSLTLHLRASSSVSKVLAGGIGQGYVLVSLKIRLGPVTSCSGISSNVIKQPITNFIDATSKGCVQ